MPNSSDDDPWYASWPTEPLSEARPLPEDDVFPVVELAQHACWRCELQYAVEELKCPHCRAVNREVTPRRSRSEKSAKPANPMTAMLFAYVAMLFVSVIHAALLISVHKDLNKDQITVLGTIFAGIDAVITFVALVACKPLYSMQSLTVGRVAGTWVLSVPCFAVLMCLNVLYFNILKDYIGGNGWLDPDPMVFDWVSIVTICVMPAVMEELFFRYVAFGVLRRVTSLHATVFVTSVMFALAHLYNPLGMPYLFLAGVVFGYARSLGGGLLLSMLLHFFHNLIVIYLESA
ncbi:hypothetical protein BH11PLA2_BH11PLA2_07210 [soil metagenome]